MLQERKVQDPLRHESLEFPAPTASSLKKILKKLEHHRKTYLEKVSLEEIILSLDQVVRLWLNPKSHTRREAVKLLSLTTGFSKNVISEGLDLAFREVGKTKLQASLKKLSEFPRPRLSVFIFAGVIPTPMIFDIFLGLLLKSAIFVKSPSRSPLFPMLLARSIEKVNLALGRCIAAFWWPGGEKNLEKILFKKADLIHGYGNDETIKKIRPQIPRSKIFLSFGHKISFGVLGKEEMIPSKAKMLANKAAYDIALYDQQGCMSPHVIYIEEGGKIKPADWAKLLAGSMQKISRRLPPAKISFGEASQIHQIRGLNIRPGQFCFSSHPRTDWTVIYEENADFHFSCLNRVIFIKPIFRIADLSEILKKQRGHFQVLGCGVSPERKESIQKIFQKLKIPILKPIGEMQKLSFQEHIEERRQMLNKKGIIGVKGFKLKSSGKILTQESLSNILLEHQMPG